MDVQEIGVHIAHCCAVVHGCKYGDEDCPVATGRMAPSDKCHDCEEDKKELTLRLSAMPADELDALLRIVGVLRNNLMEEKQ